MISRLSSRRSWLIAALLSLLLSSIPTTPAGAAGPVDGRFATDEILVNQVYLDLFGRSADRAGLAFWSDQVRAGLNPAELYNQFVGSAEFAGSVAPVARLYYSVLGRGPDAEGLRYWAGTRREGSSLSAIAEAFLAGAEFDALSSATTDDEIVEAVYGRVLGRTPDAAGLQYWRGEISSGRLTVAEFVAAVSESLEHQNRRNAEVVVTTVYLAMLQRAPDAAGLAYWTQQVRSGASLLELIDPIMNGAEYRGRFAPSPTPSVTPLVSGLTIPWGVAPLPDGTALVTERGGRLLRISADGQSDVVSADLSDLFASGETGMMGIVADPGFSQNNRFYTCQGHSSPREIQVITWTLSGTAATRVADPLVGGLPIGSGRHGGCQLAFDTEGRLIIGTGDSAVGSLPQNLSSLGGKTLRVDPTTGLGVSDNPFSSSSNPDTARLLSFGHRNVQGVSIHPETGDVWTVEHGPSSDDEVNRIVPGGNYGWNPVPGYNESVPMTDLAEFPDAVPAAWATGFPTLALADGEFLTAPQWGAWRNGFAVSALKNQSLRVLFFADNGLPLGQSLIIDGDYGRLRAVAETADGSLLVTTSNGSGNDQVLRVSPGS
ncbi:MAG: DUF4214 domain-containing protein [Acidimicrobiales bacterium]|nr:DUF4214 domain-containing protein [Acidimicrobiales bacterium]